VKLEKPDDTALVLGQTHFFKTVEDIHGALVATVPGIRFGLAFCEPSGECLVRWSSPDAAITELAENAAPTPPATPSSSSWATVSAR
jgi:adenosine/AMP kinase